MEINELKDLLAQFDASSLKELLFETGSVKVAFSKNDQALGNAGTPIVVASENKVTPAPAPAVVVEETVTLPETPIVSGTLVKSPLVGTFYLKPGPDEEDFITVGQRITQGQTLCIIEAMKVMNEIPAPVSGVVKKILATPTGMVEFDQALVEIQED